jgi:hypothetical protein
MSKGHCIIQQLMYHDASIAAEQCHAHHEDRVSIMMFPHATDSHRLGVVHCTSAQLLFSTIAMSIGHAFWLLEQ